MRINLNVSNFCQHYAFHPLAKELSPRDKTIATIATVALGILSLTLFHCIARLFFYKAQIIKLLTNPNQLYLVALSYKQQGRHQEAMELFLRVAQRDDDLLLKDYAISQLMLNQTLYENLNGGKKLYQEILPKLKSAQELTEAAIAQEEYKTWQTKETKTSTANYLRGMNCIKVGNYQEALAWLIKGAKHEDGESNDCCFLSFACHRQKFERLPGGNKFYAQTLPELEKGFQQIKKAKAKALIEKWEARPSERPVEILLAAKAYFELSRFEASFALFIEGAKSDDLLTVSSCCFNLSFKKAVFKKEVPGAIEFYRVTFPDLEASYRMRQQREDFATIAAFEQNVA